MNNNIPLKYCLLNQNGGNKFSEFIPYEEHHLLPKNKREKISLYCPDLYPFLCKKESKSYGFCKKSDIECNSLSIGKIPIKYN